MVCSVYCTIFTIAKKGCDCPKQGRNMMVPVSCGMLQLAKGLICPLYHAALCCIAERNRTKTVYLFSTMYDTAVAQRKGWLIKKLIRKAHFTLSVLNDYVIKNVKSNHEFKFGKICNI